MNNEWAPIPGETPLDDLSGLRDKSISTRVQLAIAEEQNILQAHQKYLSGRPNRRTAPFTYAWMLRVHREMFGKVWKWAGQVRTTEKNIGIPAANIGQELGGLCLDIEAWQVREDLLLEQSVLIHHRGVRIHPFENGNGRWSRLLANIWLKRHGKPIIAWPEAEVGQSENTVRKEYITAIKAADEHDLGPLTNLHGRFLSEE